MVIWAVGLRRDGQSWLRDDDDDDIQITLTYFLAYL